MLQHQQQGHHHHQAHQQAVSYNQQPGSDRDTGSHQSSLLNMADQMSDSDEDDDGGDICVVDEKTEDEANVHNGHQMASMAVFPGCERAPVSPASSPPPEPEMSQRASPRLSAEDGHVTRAVVERLPEVDRKSLSATCLLLQAMLQ